MDGKHPRQLRPIEHPVHHQTDDDDYKAASKNLNESVDYKQFMPKLKPEHRTIRRIVKIVVLLVIIGGLGYGAYYVGSHYNSKPKPKPTTAAATTKKLTSPTQAYTSSYQNLSFTYPTGWKVNETTTVLTATSPVTELTGYNRKSVDGRIVFHILAQKVALPEFGAGSATAITPSQLITYTSPTSDQEGTAYISFLNYASSKNAGIDGVYITGNAGYQSGQYVPASVVQAVQPMISLTFEKCANKSCSSTTPLTISTGSWSDKNFSGPLLTMLESLSIS